VADRFLELHRGSAEALGLMGDVELLANQPLAALKNYDAASRIRFNDRLVLRSAIAFEQAGTPEQLPQLIGRYLGLYPNSRLISQVAANQAIGAQDWSKAQLLLEMLRQRGGNRDARLLTALALVQLRNGDTKAALGTSERAWQLAPASGFAATVRALALVQSGTDADAARQLIKQARKTGGDKALLDEAQTKLH
jgi:Tfp pilus assembly protein PilF